MGDSGSKTEKATPKRRNDERKKGNVFVSRDVIVVASLISVFTVIKFLIPVVYTSISAFIFEQMDQMASGVELNQHFLKETVIRSVVLFVKTAVPIVLSSVMIAIIATIVQTKLLFSMEAVKPKFNKLNPIEGIKRLFSLKGVVELLKSLIKITILLYILYDFISNNVIPLASAQYTDLTASVVMLLNMIYSLIVKVSMVFVAVSAFDYFYQWWEYEKQIKMSKEDIKEEYKQMEGDPMVKGKIKELQRKMAQSRMMQQVPEADVIIRNPTHFAVALKYDAQRSSAPVVIAKGQDELALRIIDVAKNANVAVVENKPLARAIYASTEINSEIPLEFYNSVAEVLIYIYQLKKKTK